MHISLIISVLSAHILALMSPGPDFLVCLKNSLSYGRKAGILTALGFAAGVAIHLTWMFGGLTSLLNNRDIPLSILQYAGAVYLCYIGFMGLIKKPSFNLQATTFSVPKKEKLKHGFKKFQEGLITNFLNPKAVLFFLGLYTVLLSKEVETLDYAIIGTGLVVFTALWFSFVATILTSKKVRSKLFKALPTIHYLSSGLLLILGISIMFAKL